MGIEIERKFLVKTNEWKALALGVPYRQGYLSVHANCTVRVRVAAEKAFLTIKGQSHGYSCSEFEYEIPLSDAEQMLKNFVKKPLITKKRYTVTVKDTVWEVDEFLGENQGLVVAEVELTSEDQSFEKPSWIAEEVTGDPRYFNASLCKRPFKDW